MKTLLLLLVAALAVAGCSKKEAKTVVAPPADAGVAAVPAAPVAAAPVASVPAAANVNQAFAEADAALKQKAYDKAVQAMLAVQKQRQMTAQQAQEAHSRMLNLQANLAEAIARGDPQAIAAGQRLRQAAMAR